MDHITPRYVVRAKTLLTDPWYEIFQSQWIEPAKWRVKAERHGGNMAIIFDRFDGKMLDY